jgi:hypothetical protein
VRAVQWLVEVDLDSALTDEQSLQQRYVLGTLWFLKPMTHFGLSRQAKTWTTSRTECEWSGVGCVGNGWVTAVLLADENVQDQIPHELGL